MIKKIKAWREARRRRKAIIRGMKSLANMLAAVISTMPVRETKMKTIQELTADELIQLKNYADEEGIEGLKESVAKEVARREEVYNSLMANTSSLRRLSKEELLERRKFFENRGEFEKCKEIQDEIEKR